MNFSKHKAQSILVALFLAIAASSAQADRKMEMTWTKSAPRTVAKAAFAVTETPKHEISQEVQFALPKYSSPEYQPVEEWVYIHFDDTDGTGTHKGYFTELHKTGDTAYGTFDGAHKTVSGSDGNWTTTWEGTYKYLGGSGKYKNIRGSGTYKGRIGAKEAWHEEGRQVIEY